jgi:hypothetical protein
MTQSKQRSSFGILIDLTERLAKPFAALIGTFYISGYIITAIRLDQYGVPTSKLVDVQYFVAGIVPGILLWITVFVVFSACRFVAYTVRDNGKFRATANWTRMRWLFVAVTTIWVLPMLFFDEASLEWYEYANRWLIVVLGELSLWIIIIELRNWRHVWQGIKPFGENLIERLSSVLLSIVVVIVIIIYPVVFTLSTPFYAGPLTWDLYMSIPQAYGGGKPLEVILVVDREKVPDELLDTESGTDITSPSRTIPLDLIFRTSTEYIVIPGEGKQQQGWMIHSSVVYTLIAR